MTNLFRFEKKSLEKNIVNIFFQTEKPRIALDIEARH